MSRWHRRINAFFGRLMDALGVPELKDDPLFCTQSVRLANRTRINAIVGGKLALQTTEHWVTATERRGCRAGRSTASKTCSRSAGVAQQMVLEVEHPGMGWYGCLGSR